MALINSKYVADILNPELNDSDSDSDADSDSNGDSDNNKYKTLLDLYEEEIDKQRNGNMYLLYVFIVLAFVYPFLFFC